MFSTPLICCSSGATTVSATTSALAPGNWPLTLTTGGAISGYWATGSRPTDTAPTMTKTIDTTAAKIGRSMKKWERRMSGSRSIGVDLRDGGRCRRGARLLWRNLCAWPRSHEAVDDDIVVGRQALRDDPQAIDNRPERDVFRPGDVLGVDHQHELAHLLGPDGGVGHEQFILGRRSRHPNTRKHPGREPTARIGEHGAGADGAGGAIDGVVDEINLAVMRKRRLTDQLERDRHSQPAVGCSRAVVGELPVAQVGGLIQGELEADGVN